MNIQKIQPSQLCNNCLNTAMVVAPTLKVNDALQTTLPSTVDNAYLRVTYGRILSSLESNGGCTSCIRLFEPYRK